MISFKDFCIRDPVLDRFVKLNVGIVYKASEKAKYPFVKSPKKFLDEFEKQVSDLFDVQHEFKFHDNPRKAKEEVIDKLTEYIKPQLETGAIPEIDDNVFHGEVFISNPLLYRTERALKDICTKIAYDLKCVPRDWKQVTKKFTDEHLKPLITDSFKVSIVASALYKHLPCDPQVMNTPEQFAKFLDRESIGSLKCTEPQAEAILMELKKIL